MYRGAALPVALLSGAVWSGAAAASFHPVEDRPYRYDTVETRTADGVVRRFHASRTVVFHRTATGYDVSVTLDSVDEQAGGDVGKMFLTATGALLHRALSYRLDSDGTLLDIADADTAIALIADAIERMGTGDHARSGDSKAMASPLRTLPPERKRTMLRSVLAPLLAGAGAARDVGQRPVTLPSRPPLPFGTALVGTETVSRGADGFVTVAVDAHGAADVGTPEGTPGATMGRPASMPTATIRTVRVIDPASGLLRDSRDIAETRLSSGTDVRTTRIETIVTLRQAGK